jgi:hypothetical protein
MSEEITAVPKAQCPVCSNLVFEFKPNCHVIPKWALNLTKEDGKNFVMSAVKNDVNQADMKTQSWCEDCEKEFAWLDGVGALFFRDNDRLLSESKSEANIYVFHDMNFYKLVRLFLCSVVVRYYLYLLNDRKLSIGESIYNDIFKAYLNDHDINFVIHDMKKFSSTTSGCPVPAFKTIQLMLNGILVVLTTDMFAREYYKLRPGEIIVYNVTTVTPYVKQFKEMLRRSYTPELYERFKIKFAGSENQSD